MLFLPGPVIFGIQALFQTIQRQLDIRVEVPFKFYSESTLFVRKKKAVYLIF